MFKICASYFKQQKILKPKSILQRLVKNYLSGIGYLAAFITIITFLYSQGKDFILLSLVFILVLIIFIGVIENIKKNKIIDDLNEFKRKMKYSREKVYSENLPEINKCLSEIFYVERTLKCDIKEERERIILKLHDLCNCLSILFKRLTKHECAVSLKIITYKKEIAINNKYIVLTLARDKSSFLVRKILSDESEINNDTAYKVIFNRITSDNLDLAKCMFFCNDLTEYNFYENQRFKNINFIPSDFNIEERRKKWPLPYKSAIVFPIFPYTKEKNPDEDDILIGYLSIDSQGQNIFNEKFDTEFVKNISISIYNVMKKLHNFGKSYKFFVN